MQQIRTVLGGFDRVKLPAETGGIFIHKSRRLQWVIKFSSKQLWLD